MRIAILLVVAAAGVLPVTGRAQEGAAVACPSIESDTERLACYDRALRVAPRAPAAPPAAPTATPETPAATSAQTGAAGVAATGAAAAAANAPPPARVDLQSQSPSTISTAPRTSTRDARAPQAGAAPAVDPNSNLPVGLVPIVVLGTRVLPGHGVEFTTDRGDVWLQSDTQRLNLPATPFNAQIKAGTFGSVFLVPENRLGIRVRHRD